jgi:hypothetical protein
MEVTERSRGKTYMTKAAGLGAKTTGTINRFTGVSAAPVCCQGALAPSVALLSWYE